MTEPAAEPAPSSPPVSAPPSEPGSAPPSEAQRPPRASQGETPLYKGEPLDGERGPGLGCFWVQMIMLGVLLVLTPLTVIWAWDERISAAFLILTLILLLFAGQTVIFLLRLVAADRRSRRVPRSASAHRTVGMLEDEAATPSSDLPSADDPPADDTVADRPRPDE